MENPFSSYLTLFQSYRLITTTTIHITLFHWIHWSHYNQIPLSTQFSDILAKRLFSSRCPKKCYLFLQFTCSSRNSLLMTRQINLWAAPVRGISPYSGNSSGVRGTLSLVIFCGLWLSNWADEDLNHGRLFLSRYARLLPPRYAAHRAVKLSKLSISPRSTEFCHSEPHFLFEYGPLQAIRNQL